MNSTRVNTKGCSRCSCVLGLDEFHRDKSSSDGRYKYCKTCQNSYYRKLYADKKLAISNSDIRRYKGRLRKVTALTIVCGGRPKCFYHSTLNCCKDPYNIDYLTLDHLEGGGLKHRREIGCAGGTRFYSWVNMNKEKAKDLLVCACMNAQFIRRYNEKQS